MRAFGLFPAGAVLGLAGMVLLVVQSARALSGNALGSLASALMWAGVGLVAVGGVLLVLSVTRSDRGQPADG